MTTVCRFVLAVVFIFSGFVKAVDPLGTQYKIQDYLDAFGWSAVFPDFLPFVSSVLLGVFEFCLGVYLFFGIRRIIAPRAVLLLMALMTPLTFWLALTNPVSDCGCFGDAVVLSNWETFWKNVALLGMAVVVLINRKRIFPLATVRFDWLIGLYSFIYILVIVSISYSDLPIFDFRPYHVGASIREGMEVPEGKKPTQYETLFIMQKDGVEQEFTVDNYPDSTWTFVDTRMIVKEEGYEPPIQDFSILSMEDGEDLTEQILADENYTFLLVSHQLSLADDGAIDLINELYDYSLEYGYGFYGLTSSSDEDIRLWQENTGAEYTFALMDNIVLKTMIRSNPGLILLKDGRVVHKWSCNYLPDEYELTGPLDTLPIGQPNYQSFVRKTLRVIFWFVVPLLLMCVADLRWEKRRAQQQKKMEEVKKE